MANAIAVLDAVRERVDEAAHGQGLRAHLLLRQRRRALRRGARQAAGDGRPVGGARPRALRRAGPQAPALPLRRAGQLARAHRVPAREQRAAHRARGARGHARTRRARTGHPAAGLERGARAAAPVGPAVVAAHPAGAGLRDRPARVPRPLRGLQGHGRARGRAARGRARGDGDRRRARRRGRRRGLHEGRARRLPPRADPPHRGGRAGHRRRQPLHRGRAARRCSTAATAASSPSIRRSRRSSARRSSAGAPSATRPRSTRRSRPCARWRPGDGNIMEATLAAARAGATTGEWSGALREAFGEFRAPTGVGEAAAGPADSARSRSCARRSTASASRSGGG